MGKDRVFHVRGGEAGETLGAAVKGWLREVSWSDAKQLVTQRHVAVNGNLCLDAGRRLKEGEVVHVYADARAPVPTAEDVKVRYADADLVVVEKPAGMTTLRHAEERHWDDRRRQKQPTLDEVLQGMAARLVPAAAAASQRGHPIHPKKGKSRGVKSPPTSLRPPRGQGLRIRPVHRLDRDTSGLMIFAVSPRAEQSLVEAFKTHVIRRSYLAVAHGEIERPMTMESWIARDRGDGLRGSDPRGKDAPDAQRAVTHVEPVEVIAGGAYTVVRCRLETGRTHQIRIHLAESGHMLCGEKVYVRPAKGKPAVADESGAPRHALHSAELEFVHPVSGEGMKFSSPWPGDLRGWLDRLRGGSRRR